MRVDVGCKRDEMRYRQVGRRAHVYMCEYECELIRVITESSESQAARCFGQRRLRILGSIVACSMLPRRVRYYLGSFSRYFSMLKVHAIPLSITITHNIELKLKLAGLMAVMVEQNEKRHVSARTSNC